MVSPSLFTEYPPGRFVCDTESPERHTKNGVNCSLSLADNTSAKIESLLRSNETDAPHKHMWDTENYDTDTEHPAPIGVMNNPKDQFVVFITAVLLFGNVMLRL